MYSKSPIFPIEFETKILRTALQVNLDISKAQQYHLDQSNELDALHQAVIHQTSIIQHQRAKWHDKFIKKKTFQVGDWDLIYHSRFQ